MAFQSLYRRFRPQRFGEVIGQDHLVRVLRNAVAEDRVGHAYLLSGPRGTGKTSTARILAKALNCEQPADDGEPCCGCGSCVAMEAGSSLDLVELDAASNNRVENIREITANAALASPGRRKVYLLDEVHMLSTAASNALLKTLEEPPSHVVFILATTDPQKVLPTIRSRTQHVELNLVAADVLGAHVRGIAERAELVIDDEIVEYVVGRGRGSVRDTLSALDQVVAAGGIPHDGTGPEELLDAVAAGDLTAALAAVATAVATGVDPRDLAERSARQLRDTFLVDAGVDPGQIPPDEAANLAELGRRLGRRRTVRALESIGSALIGMRQAPDPRLAFEVALVRLFSGDQVGGEQADGTGAGVAGSGSSSPDLAGLVARIEALEARGVPQSSGNAESPRNGQPPSNAEPPNQETPVVLPGSADLASAVEVMRSAESGPGESPTSQGPAAAARAYLADRRGDGREAAPPRAATEVAGNAPPPPPPGAPPRAPSAPEISDEPAVPEIESVPLAPAAAQQPDPGHEASGVSHALVEEQWPVVLARLAPKARARFQAARLVRTGPQGVVFALPNPFHRDRCEQLRGEVEHELGEVLGTPASLVLTAEGDGGLDDEVLVPPDDESLVDVDELRDAPPDGRSSVDRITDAFPGATVVEEGES